MRAETSFLRIKRRVSMTQWMWWFVIPDLIRHPRLLDFRSHGNDYVWFYMVLAFPISGLFHVFAASAFFPISQLRSPISRLFTQRMVPMSYWCNGIFFLTTNTGSPTATKSSGRSFMTIDPAPTAQPFREYRNVFSIRH